MDPGPGERPTIADPLGKTFTCWGYTFQWTADHHTPEDVEHLRHSFDELGDAALDRLDALCPKQEAAAGAPAKQQRRDLYALLRDQQASDPVLAELWRSANEVPDWVDWDQIQRGQDVFYRYGGANLTGLAFQSLLGGMGANRVVETLSRTGGFSTKAARKRLFETTQYVLQCTRTLASLQPGGEGWASTLRVRLLHSTVRKRILKLAATHPEYYSVARFGVPVNDLDSVGTLISFSATLIWIALPRQGIVLRAQERADYLAVWRYVGHVMGAPTEPLATVPRAKAFLESLLAHEIDPSETSGVLARNVLEALASAPPTYASRDFLQASSRWLLGHELCDRLGLGRPAAYYYALVLGQCFFFMAMAYVYRSVPAWDRAKIGAMRRAMWAVIVDSEAGLKGQQAVFEFEHVPDALKRTVFEEAGGNGGRRGVQVRNLLALLAGGAILTGGAVVAVQVTKGYIGYLVNHWW